jgi:protein-ribulosamine 3-kinase
LTQPTQDPSVARLLRDDLRTPVEQAVSAYLGRVWQVKTAEGKTDEASHPAAILSDETYAVFAKLDEGDLAADQLTQEAAGLRLLTERSGVLTPVVVSVVPIENGALLILEAVQVINRELIHWRQIGQALARLHAIKGEQFGLETHCYWGSLYQDNRRLADWPEFFWLRRIEPRLRAAVASGNLPTEFVSWVERLGSRLPALCGPPVQPALLHGDAHQNNFLSTARGPVLIDPAVYYGHPEIDLAFVDFFAPVSDELYAGYQEITPIDPGFGERRALWLIHAWLAMVEIDGPQHVETLRNALHRYV